MTRELAGEIQLSDLYFEILTLKQGGLCCSQIIMKLALRELGQDNPELIRALAGLCFGAGAPEGSCGILTAAACALSCSLGTTELPDPRLPSLLSELSDWFKTRTEDSYGGTSCAAILEKSPNKRACAELLVATTEKLRALLAGARVANSGASHV
jgi:hypothetical protein